MTSKEIVRRTIEFRNPPRIPLAFWNIDLGEEPDFSHTPFLEKVRKASLDDIKCIPYFATDGGPVTRDAEGKERVDEWGVRWMNGYTVSHPLEDWNKWAGYPFPDPNAPARFAGIDEKITANQDLYLMGLVWNTTFERMWMLRGFENLLLDPYENPGLFLKLRDRYLEFNLTILDRWLQTDVDAIYFGDDLGGQKNLVMSPDTWRRYYLPMYRELFSRTRSAGKHIFFHSCGNIMEIVKDLIDCGLNVLNPVQPRAMDLKFLLKEFGKDVIIWGATDLQEILSFGTPEDVEKEIEDVISLCWRGGGYIGGTAQGNAPKAPLVNIEAFYRAFIRLSGAHSCKACP